MAYDKYQQLYQQEKQRYSKKGLSIEAQRIKESYEMQIKAAKDAVTIEALKNEELLKLKQVSSSAYLNTLKDFAAQEKDTFNALKKEITEIYSDIAKIADDKIGSVIKSQEKLEDKLSSYGHKFSHHTVYGGGENGENLDFYLLNDYMDTNQKLREYYNAINLVKNRLKENGYDQGVASDFLSIMAEMSVNEGSNFANLLSESPNNQFRQFINGYLENKQLSKEISTALYSDDLNQAVNETSAYMKEKLEKIGFEVPESFSLSGTISAEKFGASFVLELEHQLEDIRNMISDFNSKLMVTPSVTPISSKENSSAPSNITYNQSFNVGTSKASVLDQITAWKNATALARLRGE